MDVRKIRRLFNVKTNIKNAKLSKLKICFRFEDSILVADFTYFTFELDKVQLSITSRKNRKTSSNAHFLKERYQTSSH